MSLSGYYALFRANLITFLRNPLPAFGLFGVLVLILVAARFLESATTPSSKVGLAAASPSSAVAGLEKRLSDTAGLHVIRLEARDVKTAVESGRVDIALLLGPEFGQTDAVSPQPASGSLVIKRGPAAEQAALLVQEVVDGFDRDYQHAPRLLTLKVERVGRVQQSYELLLPGLLAFNLVQSGLMVVAGLMATYRSSGTLLRIQATGVSALTLVAAQSSSLLLLGIVQAALILLATEFIFHASLNVAGLLAVTTIGYLVFLAMGFAVTAWVRDPQRTPAVATLLGMPLILAGLFPSAALPGGVSQVVGILPVHFLTSALTSLIDGSASSGLLATDLAGLGAWAVGLLLLAGRVFRW
jgi:hypothetical protein